MDFLLEASGEIQREVFWAIANLLNLEVDILFLAGSLYIRALALS
jgi:hypothetical protein